MKQYDFKLIHKQGRLIAEVTIRGEIFEMGVTRHFEESNAHDDWLDYKLGLTK